MYGQQSVAGRRARRSLHHSAARIVFGSLVGATVVALAAAPAFGASTAQTPSGGAAPFARGTLVSRSGSTLDLQGFNGDTKVIVTSSTKYEQTKTADTTVVTTGSCVRVIGTGSATKGITAQTVAVSPGTSSCTAGDGGANFAGGGRFRTRNGTGGGTGTNGGQAPLGFGNGGTGNGGTGNGGTTGGNGSTGSGNGTGNGGARRTVPANFGTISGKVTKVSGDKVVVKGAVFQAPTKKNTRPKAKTKSVNVTLSSSTTVSETVTATDAVLTVGSCVNAAGSTDSVGTVTAKTVTVSAPVNGACTGGFAGFGGRGGFGGGPGGPGGPGGAGGATTGGAGTTNGGTGSA